MRWCVYILRDPRDHAVRYVGWTSQALPARLARHLYEARRVVNHRCNWLRSLLALGLAPTIHVIERGRGDEWAVRERYWIARFRSIGADLVNGTDGGEGAAGARRSPETRARISRAARGRVLSVEGRAAHGAGQRARWSREEERSAQARRMRAVAGRSTWRENVTSAAQRNARRGEASIGARLTEADVVEIRRVAASHGRGSGVALAQRYGVSKSTICDILARRTWRHV